MRAVTHTPLHQCGRSFVCKEKRVKMHANCVRLRVLLTAQSFVRSSLRWTAVHLFSSDSHVNQMPTFGTIPEHVASFGDVEKRDNGVNVLEFFSLARDGTCHFDAHLLKATSCQVVAKTVKKLWTPLSENI